MQFDLSDEQIALRNHVRPFTAQQLAPSALEWDREGQFPADHVQTLAKAGLTGWMIPTDQGGQGLNLRAVSIVCEELARGDAATAYMLSAHNMLCAAQIMHCGTGAQREQFLPKLAKGEQIGAWTLTDVIGVNDPAAIQVTATREGDAYVLSGQSRFVINANAANCLVAFARTEVDTPAEDAISAFLIETNASGLHIGPNDDKLGVRAAGTATLRFENLRVSADQLCGELNQGYRDARAILPHFQIALASVAVGIARGCLEEALRFAQQQSTGAAPILEHQSIQFMLADMATTIDAARLLVRRAAWLADRGDPYEIDAATAKLFASETATKAALDAIQICGSTGYTKDLPVERYLRDAKMLELDAGSSQMQRLDIAESVLAGE